MREIKFRAWNGLNIIYDFLVARPQFADPLKIMTDEKFALSYYGLKEWKVMQFTGLKDKNGVEIYEADIVRKTSWYFGTNSKGSKVSIGQVKWNIESASFLFYVGHYLGLFADNVELEVIGNIYQNPELLTT